MRILVLAAVLGACGPGRGGSTPAVARASSYEALRWAPADASYLLVGARLEDVARAARELVSAVLMIDSDDLESLDRGLRDALGISPWHREELERSGIDPDGGVAVFSRGIDPTLVVRVSDEARLRERIAALLPGRGVSVRLRDGVEIFSWHDRDVAIAWAITDGWLAVHLSGPRRDSTALDWYDALVARRANPRPQSPDLRAARELATRLGPAPAPPNAMAGWPRPPAAVFPNVLGVVRLDLVHRWLDGRSRQLLAPCLAPLRKGARLLLAAHMQARAGEGVVGVELAPAAALALRGWTAPAPPPGVQAYFERAPLRVRVGFDLAHLEQLSRTGCPLAPALGARTARILGAGAVTSTHVAIGALDERGVPAEAAVYLEADRAFVDGLLSRVPGRGAFERTEHVGTTPVVVLSVPLAPPFIYAFGERSFVGAVGATVMPRLLAPAETGAPPPRDGSLLEASIEPSRLPHLADALDGLARLLAGGGGSAARRLAARLSAYARGQVRLGLEGDVLVLRLGMRLR